MAGEGSRRGCGGGRREATMTPDGTLSQDLGHGTELEPRVTQLLPVMPLHAITVMHGEAGLRERLLLETLSLPSGDRGRVRDALALAARLHAGDRRQREPYLNHPLRVTIRVLSHYQVADPDVTCAALMHDVVEDHARDLAPGGARHDALGDLSSRFGARPAGLVAAVTNPVWEDGRSRHEQYREHVIASLAADPWARVIKLSDFTDNAVGLIHTSGPKLTGLAGKYLPLIPALRELALRADTPAPPLGQGDDRGPARQRGDPADRSYAGRRCGLGGRSDGGGHFESQPETTGARSRALPLAMSRRMSDDAEGFRVQEQLRGSCLTVTARNHANVAAYLFGLGEEAEAEGFLAAAYDESRRAESPVWMERGSELYDGEID
jgi:HD domain